MTILECQAKILDYLKNNDSVSFENFNLFIPTSLNKYAGITACLAALSELGTLNIVTLNQIADIKSPETLVWVLRDKLSNRSQNISICGSVASNISNIVNNFAESVEDGDLISNPLNITEKDLCVLIDIIEMYSNQDSNEENNDDSEESPPSPKNKKP
jgi:hypothetical protein